MSTDIFPEIDIPVVSVVWQFTGMPADEIETRIILINERVLTASVNDIEHIESQSLDGVGVIRIYFHPGAKIAEAEAQVTATCQTLLKVMPPGITPPYIVRYSATSVPIVQIAVSSDTLTETADLRLRRQLHHPAARHRPGSPCAATLGRQAAAGHGRSRSRTTVRPRPVAERRQRGHHQPKPDHPGRHRQDRRHGVQRPAQQQPGRDRGVQRDAGQDGQRHSDLHQGRRPRARRLRGADQHRPPRRPAGRADDHPQGRRGLDAERRQAACARRCPASRPRCRRS